MINFFRKKRTSITILKDHNSPRDKVHIVKKIFLGIALVLGSIVTFLKYGLKSLKILIPSASKIGVVISKFGLVAKGTFLKSLVYVKAIVISPFDNTATFITKYFDDIFLKANSLKYGIKGVQEVSDEAALASQQMSEAVTTSFSGFFNLFELLGIISIVALTFIFFPLIWRLMFRRRPKIFISFHHSLESVSNLIQEKFSEAGLNALKIPFEINADHQQIIKKTQDGIRSCDTMICLPGPLDSFVAHEVSSATSLRKVVIFVVRESGNLPNTADKRYLVFRLEKIQQNNFKHLIPLLHYVSMDFRSGLRMLTESLMKTIKTISLKPLIKTSLYIGLALFLVCFFQAFNATSNVIDKGEELYTNQQIQIVLSGTLVLMGFAVLILPVATFTIITTRNVQI